MARMFTAAGTGSQQTLTPANKSKIPIYANETALDADLANIPDNTLVATKGGHDDVIDQMKAYIRDQNELSEVEAISSYSTDKRFDSVIPYTSPYDGVLYFEIETGITRDLSINNNIIGHTSGSGHRFLYTIPVNKGDVFYVGYTDTETSNFGLTARFYKDRDYTGR